MKTLDIARLAAFVDGEGTISFAKIATKGAPSYTVLLTVAGTNQPFAAWLVDTFGGAVYWRPRRNPKHKASFWWRINGAKAHDLIAAMRPFLIVKPEQAWLVLEYWQWFPGYKSTVSVERRTHPKRGGRTQEDLALQTGFVESMHWLNRKGPQ